MTGIELGSWAGNLRHGAQRLHEPKTLDELSAVVAAEPRVRALGARRSSDDLADAPDALVSLRHLERLVEVDIEGSRVRVDGGISYRELAPSLDGTGLALAGFAAFPDASVAGAVATASHASGDGNPTVASAVVSFDLVTADGSVRTVHRGDPDFAGTVVGLGAFGVVSAVTFDCIPDFEVATTVYADLPWDVLVDHVDEIHAVGHAVTIDVDWSHDATSAAAVTLTAGERAMHDLFGALPDPSAPLPTATGSTDLESEYLLPQEAGGEMLERLHTLAPELARSARTTQIRTVAADDLWLSPAYDRDVVAVHFTWTSDRTVVRELLPAVEKLLLPLGARPHWGLLSTASAAALRDAFPRFDDVAALVADADPNQKFANDHLRRIGLVSAS